MHPTDLAPTAVRPPRYRRGAAGAGRARIRDIDGLRGIALTLVVFFHLFGQGRVSGGVDVFLVVSGFLLTLSLGRAIGSGAELRISARWGRTFARLAPQAGLALLAVVVLSATVFSVRTRWQTLNEVIASALYVENWQLISSRLPYGSAGPSASLLQHFWSLSVQAQFFLLFPLVAGLIVVLLRTRRARVRAFWGMLIVGTVASFVFATALNGVNPEAAYFHTGARFWELGAGGLAAGIFLLDRRIPRGLRPLTGWLGLLAIVACGFLIDGASAYPGPLALVPVGGALLVLLSSGSTARGSTSALLGTRPLVALDRMSYGLYLWHWPLLVAHLTLTHQTADQVGMLDATVVLVASIAAAWAGQRLLSAPTRWAVSGRTGRSLSFAATVIVLIVVPTGTAALHVAPSREAVAAIELDECQGAAAFDPQRNCTSDPDAEGELLPALTDLVVDDDHSAECWGLDVEDPFRWCTLGPKDGYDMHLLALGDSHNAALEGMYAKVAYEHNWRIDISSRAGCAWSSAVRASRAELKEACDRWRDEATALVNSDEMADLDALLVTQSSTNDYTIVDPGARAERLGVRNAERWAMRDRDIPVLAILDNPIFGRERNGCIDDRDAVRAGDCATPRDEALRVDGLAEAAALDGNAGVIDLRDHMCDESRCFMVVGDVIVTRDGAHLSGTFARSLAPYFADQLLQNVELPLIP